MKKIWIAIAVVAVMFGAGLGVASVVNAQAGNSSHRGWNNHSLRRDDGLQLGRPHGHDGRLRRW